MWSILAKQKIKKIFPIICPFFRSFNVRLLKCNFPMALHVIVDLFRRPVIISEKGNYASMLLSEHLFTNYINAIIKKIHIKSVIVWDFQPIFSENPVPAPSCCPSVCSSYSSLSSFVKQQVQPK